MKKIAFIGGGNIASALISGMLSSDKCKPTDIIVSNPGEEKRNALHDKFGVEVTRDNVEAVLKGDIILLTVKPSIYKSVIDEIKGSLDQSKILVTVAPGISISYIESLLEIEGKIVRTMPNTPSLVREGITSICPNKNILEKDLKIINELFACVGEVEIIDEKLMNVATAVAGSSPALVYMFIEALADGAVLNGMSRDKAYLFASQAVLGSAKMVKETGISPATLKDNVASPGGTTIEAISHLEASGFRGIIIEAMRKTVEKAKKMGE